MVGTALIVSLLGAPALGQETPEARIARGVALRQEGRDEAAPQHCDACLSGDYPTSLTDHDDLERRNQLLLQEGRRA